MPADLDITATLPPGFIRTRALDDAITSAWIANGRNPLSQAQVLAITGPPPPYPVALPRFPDSNPPPRWWSA